MATNDEAATASEAAESGKPTPINAGLPVVGIGASAGGLAAFEAFFSGMPAQSDPGMAFVLVQHLAPDHKSILADLVRRYTRMQVFEVEDGISLQANCAYIIPPNRDMAFLNGALQLLEPVAPRGQRLPIDYFFRSLAQDLHERAIGIVLSGTGSDGTLGVRAIKGAGGMVMVQNPESTEFDGMPRSAIATGLVDYELPPAEMAAQLIAYVAHAFGSPPRVAALPTHSDAAMKKIFVLLRNQTTHDFSLYKPSTIQRRIERRLAVHQIDGLDNYVKYLQQTPAEVESLFRDLLIGVTSFFRDREAFDVLGAECIPKLLADSPSGAVIRVWCAGCSTGEEAYSLAMLLQEQMEKRNQTHTVQLFATDIDNRAIATARAGLYPASIATDLTPERLERFFTAEADGSVYRINKEIRDMLVFSEQDVLKDPPFSKLDLISCRNLLIYLGGQLQKKLIPLFRYALKPNGMLFLGTSEGVGDFEDLFAGVDRKSKLFRCAENQRDGMSRATLARLVAPVTAITAAFPTGAAKARQNEKPPMRELTEQTLLQQIAPACVLVNDQGDILYLHGRTGMYLEPTPGESRPNNILTMAREGLRHELSATLHQAAREHVVVRRTGLRVKTNGDFTMVNLTIRPTATTTSPTAEEQSPFYLVILEDAPDLAPEQVPMLSKSANAGEAIVSSDADAVILALKEELRTKEEYLRTTYEELETSSEELKSSNEEMQSMNEELQATNEELETSKEELQSINEELATVNTELQAKVGDLSRTNNDMNNLLSGTGIATIFVDMQLRVLRFTPTASVIINLIPSDVGRPVQHIVSNLTGYDSLVNDAKCVLDTLGAKEKNVQTTEGRWYKMHIQPYRTLENVIEGVVLTFVDITEMEQTRGALRKANELLRLAVVVRDAHDAITVQDMEGHIIAWNSGAERMYGWSESEALQMNVLDRIPETLRVDALTKVHLLSRTEILEPYRTQRLTKDGAVVEIWMTATALLNENQQTYAIATTERERGLMPPKAAA
jgi:two-component system, chemotaxis family, CheB/CheR fusion protein